MQSTAIPIIHGRTVYLAHLIAMLIAVAAHGQCNYEVTAIIQGPGCFPSNNPTPLIARGMNSHGHVVGHVLNCDFSGHDIGFFWTPDTGRVLMHKPDNVWRVNATDINDHGMIVGSMSITGVGSRGFVYDMHRQDYLMLLEPLQGAGDTTINAINNAGIAVGSRSIGKPGVHPIPYNAVIWNTHTGEITDLGVGDGPSSEAMDISESGEYVVGWADGTGQLFGQAAIWTNGKLQIIGPLPGTDNSIINAVNESGVAVGSGLNQTIGWRAFIWDGAFTIIDGTDGWQAARGRAINNLGQALFNFSQLQQGHTPLLWQHGELHYLQPLLVSDQQNHSFSWAVGTNDHGQLLCITSSNYAVVLSPADRPLTDLNADCRTDVHDLLMLLDAWGPLPRAKLTTELPVDFNGDGVVNVSDLLILLANWDH